MTKKREKIFFCHYCHDAIENASKVLLIEEENNRSFCSEECILHFYTPRNDYFEKLDLKMREELSVSDPDWVFKYKESEKHIKKTLEEPDEVWEQENDLGEVYMTHLKKFSVKEKPFWFLIICFYFQDGPSFIFFQSVTTSIELLDFYRVDSDEELEVEMEQTEDEIEASIDVPPEVLETVELKKSTFLAHLLESRSEEDIDYEKFPRYETNTVSTLEEPDEIFKYNDEEGDTLLTYVKSYQKDKQNFFYIVICMKVDMRESANEEVLIPIVSFPSQDKDLYIKYAHGERISGNIKN